MMEVAKRLCTDHNVAVAEIHSYHQVGDELRFVPVYRAPVDARRVAAPGATKRPAARAQAAKAKKKPKKVTKAPVRRKTSAPKRPARTRRRA
jgi:hypothetical protein